MTAHAVGGIAVDRLASIPADVRVAERPQDRDDKGDETKSIPEEQRRADPAYPATREDPRRAEG
jgi:hypothetical protein